MASVPNGMVLYEPAPLGSAGSGPSTRFASTLESQDPSGLTCWRCGYWTPKVELTCPNDGTALLHLALPDPLDPLVGQVVEGRFYVSHRLGTGGAARVYTALALDGGRYVALKTLNAELRQNPGMRARFVEEARLMRELGHPCIPTVEHLGELATGDLFMIMQFIDGETLFQRAQRAPLSIAEILRLIAVMCRCLVHIHRHGVVHADIKPSNVLLCCNFMSIKLIDFGVAVRSRSGPMRYGEVLGTPAYASPEQLEGRHLDGRSDLYSLSTIAYELLTLRLPFPESRFAPVPKRHPPPPLHSHPGLHALPRELDAFIIAGLAPRAEDRPESAQELLRRCLHLRRQLHPELLMLRPAVLVQAAESRQAEQRTRRVHPETSQSSRRWRLAMALGLLLAAILALMIASL